MVMAASLKHTRRTPVHRPGPLIRLSTFRYWLLWALLIAVLAIGINAYFDYRNRELDKRIERLKTSYR